MKDTQERFTLAIRTIAMPNFSIAIVLITLKYPRVGMDTQQVTNLFKLNL